MENPKQPLLYLAGPTGIGKTAVALEVAEAMGAEVVSLDSMKVYRGMDILTAKPTEEERERARFHMTDLVDACESFSTADYLREVVPVIEEIESRGKRILFDGGTGLYLRAMTEGLFEGPEADWSIRDRLKREASEKGTPVLHERLADVDPAAAGRIHENDLRRIVRALEVYELTGRPLSELQDELTRPPLERASRIFVLHMEREALKKRIRERVNRMLSAGLVEEVERVRAMGPSREAAQALGYKEVLEYLEGKANLEEAVDNLVRNTALFARKQMTFLRSFEEARWVEVLDPPDVKGVSGEILKVLE